MKKFLATMMVLSLAMGTLAGCSSSASTETAAPAESAPAATEEAAAPAATGNEKLVVGFAQLGQESGWRAAETESILFYAGQNLETIELQFSDAQQKQENQIKNIRTYIQMGVDVIAFPPVVTTGWETVLQECKDAGIPVILVDRTAEVSDDLYATVISSDFVYEGQLAAQAAVELLGEEGGNIVILEGTVGASAAIERQQGFNEVLAQYDNITVLDSQSGDFTKAGGKTVMESFLKSYSDIDLVYGDNDDMVHGAIEAIKEAGLNPGSDIMTVSVDGNSPMFQAILDGEANAVVECNPLLGPSIFETAQKLKDGEAVDKWIVTDDAVYINEEVTAEVVAGRMY